MSVRGLATDWPGTALSYRFLLCLLFVLAAFLSRPTNAADESLLSASDTTLVSKDLNARQIRVASQLTDGNSDVPVPQLTSSLSIVFEFSEVVSPNELVIHLPATDGDELIGEIEVLSSLVSPDAGFQLLRAVTVSTNRREQSHDFQAVGTRWLMIRYTPADNPPGLGISEIAVLGQAGAPASVYEFKESPVGALQVLEQLESVVAVNVSPAETALFEDAADGQLDSWTLAEAALLASGVTDEAARAALVQRIDALEQSFRAGLSGDLAPFEVGQSLLQWLHENAFEAGYSAGQTDLSTVLTDNSYNCVSSAVLYSILGVRLGLDVRGVEVPDHAFAILYDGSDYADIETTTSAGFNPARNREAIEAFQSTTGFSYIPDRRPDKRREISPLELVSFIYYNHGVELSRDEKYLDALLTYFRALSLDRDSRSAVKNALAALANWSVSLSKKNEFEEALRVVELGLALAPADRSLNYNHRVIWQNRINQGAEELDIGSFTELIAKAHAALPEAGFESQQALYFIKRAETSAEQGQWMAAIAQVSEGLPGLNEASQKNIGEYRLNLLLRWSNREIEARQWEAALDALDHGLELLPGNRRISQNIAYVLQEWSEQVYADSGEAAAEEIVSRIAERYPQIGSVQRAGRNYAIRRINELSKEARYSEALSLIDEYQYLIGSDRDFDTMVRSVFDAQAEVYIAAGNVEAALAVYEQARTAFPDNRQIRQNQVATWHKLARSHMDARHWNEALAVYESGLESLPDERSFRQNTKYILQEWLATLDPGSASTRAAIDEIYSRDGEHYKISPLVSSYYMKSVSELQKNDDFEASLRIAKIGRDVIREEKEAIKVHRYAYDNWARRFTKTKAWSEAIEVYESALDAIPDDRHLMNNAVAAWHSWAQSYMDKKDWDGAIEIYAKGLERLPDTRLFQQNIAYCEQQRDQP